jgi:hypothetical protein
VDDFAPEIDHLPVQEGLTQKAWESLFAALSPRVQRGDAFIPDMKHSLDLLEVERDELVAVSLEPALPLRCRKRAMILLEAAQGKKPSDISRSLEVSRPTIAAVLAHFTKAEGGRVAAILPS